MRLHGKKIVLYRDSRECTHRAENQEDSGCRLLLIAADSKTLVIILIHSVAVVGTLSE